MDLRHMANLLGGDVVAGQITCPGPGHGRKDRSLVIRFAPGAPGGFVVHSFANDPFDVCREHVQRVLGLDSFTPPDRVADRRQERAVANQNRALAIWRASGDPSGSPVERYLERRGVLGPAKAAFGHAIKFHPTCPFGGKHVPCLVALVRNMKTDEPQAIHRTALTRDGEKAIVKGNSRLGLGPFAGGAIKLTRDENVTTCLGIGEGIETTLSLQLLREFGTSPIWAMLNAGGVASFPVLNGIEVLWIAVDHDPAGRSASLECVERWLADGRETIEVVPNRAGADVNDSVRRHG